jgi:hypothetical protein
MGRAASAGLLLLAAGVAQAGPIGAFAPAARDSGFEESFHRVLEAGGATAASRAYDFIEAARIAAAADESEPAERIRKPHTFWIGVVSFATIAGSAYNSFGDGANQKWHFTNEGWIGQNTYAGGGDKASHFVSYYIVGKLLAGVNEELGMRPDPAALLGAGVSAFAGFVTELGDGRGRYGFSYEDMVTDFLGAAASLAISRYGLDDLIGFRAGLVPAPTAVCCPYGGIGKDYTQEIYTADLKFAGLGERAKFNPGPARFLMFSVSYSAKGYPYADPAVRERQVGFELGVNFGEILRVIGVPRDKWWGKILYFGFDVLRIPYTQIGMYYDLNSGKWRGPGIGDTWPGGGQ